MTQRRRGPELQPHERRALDEMQESQHDKQPYATELDNRELEHAETEKRPVRSHDEGTKPGKA